MPNEKGLAPLVLILVLALIGAAVAGYVLFMRSKNVLPGSSNTQSAPSSVNLQKKYENPFDTKTNYVNPFAEYKNPFDSLK